MQLLADRQYTAPSAANAVSSPGIAILWGSTAYVELLAAAPAACVLTGVIVGTTVGESTGVGHDFEVDIATGAAGAEVVIATVRGFNKRASVPYGGPTLCCVLPIPIDNIAAGVRIAGRVRRDTTNTGAYKIAITYLQKPLTSTILTTAVRQRTLPPAASGITVTAGSPAWASGTWQQLRAASGAALVVTGIVGAPSLTASYELDLGTGTAGAETVITTIRLSLDVNAFPAWVMLPTPLDTVAASTRVAARLRSSTASTTLIVSLMVLEKPL